MRGGFLTLALVALAVTGPGPTAAARELTLQGYRQPDGALTVTLAARTVDPYFAGKALLAAREAGADASGLARAWIAWILPFQRRDGGFDRLCRGGLGFVSCDRADADDATLAVWMELLTRFAPAGGMPAEWRRSFEAADRFLATLRDPASGVYQIAPDRPVALLMDNIEILAAFQAVAEAEGAAGRAAATRRWSGRAERLRKALLRVFREPDGRFRVSTQAVTGTDFYPYQVAQVFPLLADVERPHSVEAARYARWMAEYRDTWLRQGRSDYPWALVALVADRMGDRETVRCWRARAIQFRHGEHWNVLEEALLEAFDGRLSQEEALAPACGPEVMR